MGKKVIITKKCPVCKYEYRAAEEYGVVEKNGKTEENVIKREETNEDFYSVNVVGEDGNITTIAIECPNCGVHMNPEKCTTKEEV